MPFKPDEHAEYRAMHLRMEIEELKNEIDAKLSATGWCRVQGLRKYLQIGITKMQPLDRIVEILHSYTKIGWSIEVFDFGSVFKGTGNPGEWTLRFYNRQPGEFVIYDYSQSKQWDGSRLSRETTLALSYLHGEQQ